MHIMDKAAYVCLSQIIDSKYYTLKNTTRNFQYRAILTRLATFIHTCVYRHCPASKKSPPKVERTQREQHRKLTQRYGIFINSKTDSRGVQLKEGVNEEKCSGS
jgi:hypothetical protein